MTFRQALEQAFAIEKSASSWRDIPSLNYTDIKSTNQRYGVWAKTLNDVATLPTEYLLPKVIIPFEDKLPRSMASAEQRYNLNPGLARELSNMRWGYYFYLGGGLSTMDGSPAVKQRSRANSILRMQAINGVVEKVAGANKPSMTVLDFACNWGGMAIDMALRGFKNVEAFDFKEENIRRASLLAEYMGASNVSFKVHNVFDLPEVYDNGFDVVYNLGLLYHVTNPLELAKITYRLTRHIAVFDTLAHKEPFSGYIQAYVSDESIQRSGMGEEQLEFHPTYRGIIDLIQFVGFKDMIEIVPAIDSSFPEREKEHYFIGHRRTIVAFK